MFFKKFYLYIIFSFLFNYLHAGDNFSYMFAQKNEFSTHPFFVPQKNHDLIFNLFSVFNVRQEEEFLNLIDICDISIKTRNVLQKNSYLIDSLQNKLDTDYRYVILYILSLSKKNEVHIKNLQHYINNILSSPLHPYYIYKNLFVFLYILIHDQENFQKNSEYTFKAIQEGHTYAQYYYLMYLSYNNQKDDFDKILKIAEQNIQQFAPLLYLIGKNYLLGENCTKNPQIAFEFFSKINHSENIKYQIDSAKLCLEEEYFSEAFYFFKKAAEYDKAPMNYRIDVQNHLAECYFNGKGVSKNTQSAISHWTSSMYKGCDQAAYCLAKLYLTNPEENKEKILYCLKKAVEKNNMDAGYELGKYYAFSDQHYNNAKKGIEIFVQLAKNNYNKAIYAIGKCYLYGLGTQIDEEKAFACLKKAIQFNICEALYELGICYLYGLGTSINTVTAFDLFEKADKFDVPQASYEIGKCYLYGIGVEKNSEKAMHYFKKAESLNLDVSKELSFLFPEDDTSSSQPVEQIICEEIFTQSLQNLRESFWEELEKN